MSKFKAIEDMLCTELQGCPDAHYSLVKTSKHLKVWISIGERSRFVTMSASASDGRAIKNQRRDVRRVLHELTDARI